MSLRFLKYSPVYVFVAFIMYFGGSGCRENTLINAKISPSSNAVSVYSYTLPVVTTHSYLDDSTITSTNLGGIPIYQAVGAINDPFFGSMVANTYFQIVPTTLDPYVYLNDSIDSAVLILPYSGYTYGDTTNLNITQTYQVFYMTDTMSLTSNYYCFNSKAIDNAFPLSAPTTINISSLKDSFGINVNDNDFPSLRIKLNVPLLLSHVMPALNILLTSTNPYQDWLNSFPGICVQVSNSRSTTNAIPYFRLDGSDAFSQAGILVYYHAPGADTGIGDTLIENYYFNTALCAHFNNITKSFRSSPVNNYIHSTLANDSIIVLQNQPGPCIDVYIPGIMSIPKGIINKAELQIPLIPRYYSINHTNDTLDAPENLTPLGISNGTYPAGVGAGLGYEIADRYPLTSLTPLTVLDGNLHNLPYFSDSVQTFTIDIPREVIASQAAGNDVIHLHLSGTSDYYGAFHMVAGGGAYPDSMYRARFVVTYSKLKNP